ncbi:TonB-dependent siderophore receptor [Magnetospirillum sp. XM-1]|uniref:TonB-dependent receptor plug domain-containing protein n=1 Tax=Magnetospirillum sp. XM-1 TaxID=1663591 RepID=UPI00155F6F86|nr:TonB-dependent receptor [Magnetospirillum sp. XM-1]
MKKTFAALAACTALVPVSLSAAEPSKVFTLGQVNASAPAQGTTDMGGSTITQDDIQQFNRESLDRAIDLVPGASVSLGGARNERNIWIRGFDRWRVPLYFDGIRAYMPADNRIDFGLFTTNDIAEIQVSKGYTSMIDGPGAMGGAINLVSRKVTRPREADLRLGASFSDNGAFNGFVADAFGGARLEDWYVQGSVTKTTRQRYSLSDDYQATQIETGGFRDHSFKDNMKANVKVGYEPSPFDEYSLNVVTQFGAKDIPFNEVSNSRYWIWPAWDKQSLYWISKTGLDEKGSYVKVRAYVDRFFNQLNFYDDSELLAQTTTGAARSYYEDYAFGGTTEGAWAMWNGRNTLKAALHYRHDIHDEWNEKYKIGTVATNYTEPHQRTREETWSLAVENTFHPIPEVDVIPGISYDYRHLIKADKFSYSNNNNANGRMIAYPRNDDHALNPQLAVAWRYDPSGSVHASASRRTRFPTLFERFSNRFGTFTGNADLKAERSNNLEAGVTQTIGHTKLGANVFQSWLEDAIVSVALGGNTTQNQNIGKAIHKGFELELTHAFSPELEVGANYANLLRTVPDKSTQLTDTPRHKAFVYANWKPLDGLSVVPSVEIGGNRYLTRALPTTATFEGGEYVVANLKAGYQFTEQVYAEAGANNLLDSNYKISDGYHEEGRNIFANLRVKF